MRLEYRHKGMPHFHHVGHAFSVTVLLDDAIPKPLLHSLREQRQRDIAQIRLQHPPDAAYRIFEAERRFALALEDLLHRHESQSHLLARVELAAFVADKLRQYDGQHYTLCAYAILSNHFHALLDFSMQTPDDAPADEATYVNLSQVMNLIKGGSSRAINLACGRTGTLWSPHYYDRYIRNERHFWTAYAYILNNPVKAGLVGQWTEHHATWGRFG